MKLIVAFVLFAFVACDENNGPIGCFKYSSVVTNYVTRDIDATDPKCIVVCSANYYRQATNKNC